VPIAFFQQGALEKSYGAALEKVRVGPLEKKREGGRWHKARRLLEAAVWIPSAKRTGVANALLGDVSECRKERINKNKTSYVQSFSKHAWGAKKTHLKVRVVNVWVFILLLSINESLLIVIIMFSYYLFLHFITNYYVFLLIPYYSLDFFLSFLIRFNHHSSLLIIITDSRLRAQCK